MLEKLFSRRHESLVFEVTAACNHWPAPENESTHYEVAAILLRGRAT